MARGRPIAALILRSGRREPLGGMASSRSLSAGRVCRAKMILLRRHCLRQDFSRVREHSGFLISRQLSDGCLAGFIDWQHATHDVIKRHRRRLAVCRNALRDGCDGCGGVSRRNRNERKENTRTRAMIEVGTEQKILATGPFIRCISQLLSCF
jgi:hypothetical protein